MNAKQLLMAGAIAAAAVAPSQAQVSGSIGFPPTVISGQAGAIDFRVVSPGGPVHGINGKLSFGNGYMSNMALTAGPGAAGFTVAVNEVTAGDLRFVLYKNPPDAALDLSMPVLHLAFDVAGGVVGAQTAAITFQDAESDGIMEAAARILPDPPNDVVSLGVGGPGGNPPAVNVAFGGFGIPVMGVPLLGPNPQNQTVNVGQTATFEVGAQGLGTPFGYQWFDQNGSLSGQNGSSLQLVSVTTAMAGPYRCDVSNAAGTSSSTNATLTVLDPRVANSAVFIDDSIPAVVFTGQSILVGVVMQNTSQISWSSSQGFSLAVTSDPSSLFSGQTRIPLSPAGAIVPLGNGIANFTALIQVPSAPGVYNATVQMIEEGFENFGPAVQLTVNAVDRPNTALDMKLFE